MFRSPTITYQAGTVLLISLLLVCCDLLFLKQQYSIGMGREGQQMTVRAPTITLNLSSSTPAAATTPVQAQVQSATKTCRHRGGGGGSAGEGGEGTETRRRRHRRWRRVAACRRTNTGRHHCQGGKCSCQ
eukprot:SAG22_NODE_96_length_20771_cov_33.186018_21_plen_130_part_00